MSDNLQEIDVSITLSEESQFVGFADAAVGQPMENVRIHVGVGMDSGFSLKGPPAVLKNFAEFILSTLEPIDSTLPTSTETPISQEMEQ